MSTEERFLARTIVADGCWEWTASTVKGYAHQISHEGRRMKVTHWALLHYRGVVVPKGMEVDHVCHVPAECDGGETCPHRRCVNPAHLEVVSRQENQRRRHTTKCRRGHVRTEANTLLTGGKRVCRECVAITRTAWDARRKSVHP